MDSCHDTIDNFKEITCLKILKFFKIVILYLRIRYQTKPIPCKMTIIPLNQTRESHGLSAASTWR